VGEKVQGAWRRALVLLARVTLAGIACAELNVPISSWVVDVCASRQFGVLAVPPIGVLQAAGEIHVIKLDVPTVPTVPTVPIVSDPGRRRCVDIPPAEQRSREEILTRWKRCSRFIQ
jgi:hypothetical protein